MAPLELLVYAFQDEQQADEALTKLREIKKQGIIDIVNAAVLIREMDGTIKVKDTADPEPKKGALIGGVVGGLLGLLGGPVAPFIGVAAGAGIGALIAKNIDLGIPNDQLTEIAEGLQPGTSSIIALIEHRWVDQLIPELENYGKMIVRQALKEEIADQLRRQVEEATPAEVVSSEKKPDA